MKLLVTGGTGFLGKHIKEKLKANGVKIFGNNDYSALYSSSCGPVAWMPSKKELNIADAQCLFEIGDYEPDVILHMAAVCGGILANKNSPANFLHKNLDMASNIFHYAHVATRLNRKISIYTLGSVCAYPKHCPTPFKEDDIWNGYPEETNAPYGIAKRNLMLLGQTYRDQYGVSGAHLIPVNLYGEHDHFDLINSHVIPALISKFCTAKDEGLPQVECWGTGEATREFLYAADAADAIVKAIINKLDTPLPINLGTGHDISIKDLANLIKDLVEYEGEIIFNGNVSDGQPKRLLDISRAKELLNWQSSTNFKDGLRKTIKWYRDNK